ncbi:unnamed protein product [Oikopleura dioica]|uniref:Uncharacterized protein n=1 Tax=Oikopleura dioica TaxID=34765 RepID=E4XRB0_OIKDI|nr:unnamed protein product [Oikopleura dioica]
MSDTEEEQLAKIIEESTLAINNAKAKLEEIAKEKAERELEIVKLSVEDKNKEMAQLMDGIKKSLQEFTGLTKNVMTDLGKIDKLYKKIDNNCPNIKPEEDDFVKTQEDSLEENFKEWSKIIDDEKKNLSDVIYGPGKQKSPCASSLFGNISPTPAAKPFAFDLEILEENGGEISGVELLMHQHKCRADRQYDESQSKGKIKRLLASVVSALKELRLDFVHTRRVECGHKQQVMKITKIMLTLDDKLIEVLPKMADDPSRQIVDLVKLLIHMHRTLEEKQCALSGNAEFKLEKGYLTKLLNKLDAQDEAEIISGGFKEHF